jgi:hypothetical protein
LLPSTGVRKGNQACVLDARGSIAGERAFSHDGAGLALLCDWILSIAGSATVVAVGVEVPHGPVVDSLQDRGMAVHAINPKQLDRLRDRFSVSGAKDDRRDAYVAADGLHTDRHLFRRLHVADPRLVELREWARLAEELQQERVRLSNRLHDQLWRYYPQMLGLSDDIATDWLLDIWTMAPTPEKSKQLRKTSAEQLLKRNRIRRIDAETVLRTLRQLPSRWPTELRKLQLSTFAPSSPVCASSIASFATPLTKLMSYVQAWMRRELVRRI